jgi:hypothetical protein
MTPLPSIHPLLNIGTDEDAMRLLRTVRHGTPGDPGDWHQEPVEGWALIHAAKSPWHINLLGYTGGPAPVGHPERWWADREHRTFLNLVDSPSQLPELVIPVLDHAAEQISTYIDQ